MHIQCFKNPYTHHNSIIQRSICSDTLRPIKLNLCNPPLSQYSIKIVALLIHIFHVLFWVLSAYLVFFISSIHSIRPRKYLNKYTYMVYFYFISYGSLNNIYINSILKCHFGGIIYSLVNSELSWHLHIDIFFPLKYSDSL